ncbi:MAG TPA: hypothetical protein VFE61_10235 [Candidatus Sulfotelmatobacter sp.]|jgi:nitrous oxidase accessory protein NosD|nr:hypothetical protein [Candidatus Sulfotelmatobacter sp.]
MKDSLLLAIVLLALASTAMASTTWYVNGGSGNDGDTCASATTACKTIGHAVSLASSGDSILVSSGTYKENLSIAKSLRVMGSGANMTIVDGGGIGLVFLKFVRRKCHSFRDENPPRPFNPVWWGHRKPRDTHT